MSVARGLVLLTACLCVTGCGWTGRPAPPHKGTVPASSAVSAGTAPLVPVSGGPVACRAADLRGALGAGSGVTGGKVAVVVDLTVATGAAPCVLQGVPRVELVDASGRVLPTAQTATSLPGGSPVPLGPDGAVVAGGARHVSQAHVVIRWDVCGTGAPPVATLRVLLAGNAGGASLPLHSSVLAGAAAPCGGLLNVGPFLPGKAPA